MSDHWFQTVSGLKFDLAEPDPETITIADLSWALARLCRFGGHLKSSVPFYSVAQHSIFVSRLVESEELKLPALLHDAHEAFWGFGDVISPVKFKEVFVEHESKIDKAVAARFKFDVSLFKHPEIVHADAVALSTERRDLMEYTTLCWRKETVMDEKPVVPFENVSYAAGAFASTLLFYELMDWKRENGDTNVTR